MIGYRVLAAAVLVLFFAGCSHDTIVQRPQISEPIQSRTLKSAMPAWFLHVPENSLESFYGVGKGRDIQEAEENAVSDLNSRVWSDFIKKRISGADGHKYIIRYLSKEAVESTKSRLKKIPISKYRVLKSYSGEDGTAAVLVEIKRKDLAKPLKKEILGRLVSIEERWHSSRGQTVLERYILAKDSFEKMSRFLPDYLLADYISPFSGKVASRVENGLPYFYKTANRLKKSLRFCIEPVSTPAMKFFADAVAKALKKEQLVSTNETKADSRTLCITINGTLLHKKSAQDHIFEATVKLTLHKRYKAPISVQYYKVRGISQDSGTMALQKAAQELEKELQKRFLQAV